MDDKDDKFDEPEEGQTLAAVEEPTSLQSLKDIHPSLWTPAMMKLYFFCLIATFTYLLLRRD
jgi:hypothetical protein